MRRWMGALGVGPHLLLSLCGVACGEAQHGSGGGGSDGQGGDSTSGGASAGGHPNAAGSSGTTNKAGSSGAPSSSGGVPSGGTAGSHAGGGGAPEADGGDAPQGEGGAPSEPCNDLELVVTPATCTTYAALPPAQGGTIVPGTYAMQSYQMPICFAGLQQTVRILETAADVFSVETVANIGATRANGTFVRSPATISSTSTCGGTEQDKIYSYDAYRQQQVDYFRLWDGDSVFVYEHVDD